MPLNLKTFLETFRLVQGKFQKEIPTIDPTIKASLTRATVGSTAAAAASNNEGIQDAVKQSFWQTQDDEFLEQTGEYDDTTRFGEQIAAGFGSVGGVLGTSVPIDTPVTFGGNSYITVQDSAVQSYSGDVSLSYSAGIATAVTALPHTLASGLSVVISGATQPDYNGTFEITALDENTFTYELVAGALTTDNGLYTSEYALLSMESVNTGEDQNVGAGAIMVIDLTDIDDDVFVGVDGIVGGLEEEDIEDYRVRVGESHSLTPGISTAPSLKASAKSIPGNTRVFVVRPDGTSGGTQGVAGYKPELGETVVYILRDDDPSILPSAQILDTTKQQIIDDGLWPTFIGESFLYVLAPILVAQDFAFSSITPSTVTMQNAIREQLVSFFEDNSGIEVTIALDTINSFLRQVQDPATGAFLTDFTYNNPSSDLVPGSGEIFTLGTVSFT